MNLIFAKMPITSIFMSSTLGSGFLLFERIIFKNFEILFWLIRRSKLKRDKLMQLNCTCKQVCISSSGVAMAIFLTNLMRLTSWFWRALSMTTWSSSSETSSAFFAFEAKLIAREMSSLPTSCSGKCAMSFMT